MFYRASDLWIFDPFPAATDLGLSFLRDERMITDRGTAILNPDPSPGAQEIGFDSDRTETGHFGINIHRANRDRFSIQVDNWSAG